MTYANRLFDAVTDELNPLSIVQGLQNDPETIALIGAIILSYAEIEFRMSWIYNLAKSLPDGSLEFFTTKPEGKRITKFESEVVPIMNERGYEADFAIIVTALKRAKKYRNQYAHCIWSTEPPLKFLDLEDAAKTGNPTYNLVSTRLMKRQLTYIRTITMILTYYMKVLSGSLVQPDERENSLHLLSVEVPNHGE